MSEQTETTAVASTISADKTGIGLAGRLRNTYGTRGAVVWGIVIVLCGLLAFVFGSYNREYYLSRLPGQDRVVFKINNTVYRQSAVKPLTAYLTTVQGASYQQAVRSVYELYYYKAAADKTGIHEDASFAKTRTTDLGYDTYELKNWQAYVALVGQRAATEYRHLYMNDTGLGKAKYQALQQQLKTLKASYYGV